MASKLHSDVSYDFSAFDPKNAPEATIKLNEILIQRGEEDVKWWEVGPAEYRKRRAAGQTVFPAPVLLPNAVEIQIPALSDPERMIPCRVFKPASEVPSKGVFCHFHGGGWVLGTASGQDLLLDHIAQNAGLTVVSVEYRLAPEHVLPAGVNDCNDVAEWLATTGKEEFGPLLFLGGESAGGTLTAMVLLHLRAKSLLSTVRGSVLNYGAFDLSLLPSALTGDPLPVLRTENILMFTKAYTNDMSAEERKSGKVSPMYNDLSGLGSALFLIGTEDVLMDDNVLMHFRWRRAGNEAVMKFVAGAPHGFANFDGKTMECAREGWKIIIDYLKEKLA